MFLIMSCMKAAIRLGSALRVSAITGPAPTGIEWKDNSAYGGCHKKGDIPHRINGDRLLKGTDYFFLAALLAGAFLAGFLAFAFLALAAFSAAFAFFS